MHDIAWHMLHSISDKKYEVFRFLVTVVFYECGLRLIFSLNVFWENVGLGEERMRKRGAGWRGGWTFLAVKTQMKERITGSHFLCERDRERERKSKIMHERGKVRVKEKPVNHLKRLWGWHLHVHLLTLNIPRLSQSQWISLFSCDVLFDFVVFVRKNALLWFTHCKGFDRQGGKAHQKKL